MKTSRALALAGVLAVLLACDAAVGGQTGLEAGWDHPPTSARLRAYWWWLNGNVTKPAITRDLEEMKAKGFGGAVIIDAGGAEQDGNDRVPHGPTFFSSEWRELYKHALREADRLGLEMSLNIQSGWNLGGPMVSADDAAKKLTWSEMRIAGPTNFNQALPAPKSRDNYYRDLFVVAYQVRSGTRPRPLQNWEQKAMYQALNFSAPDTTPLFQEVPAVPGEEETRADAVMDLTSKLGPNGVLNWEAPPGTWQILRFGCTIGDHSRVSTSSDGWQGYALDVLDAGAFQRYWDAVVEPLIADAGPLAGRTLKYLHTDSWEVEAINWTPTLRDEFQNRRGYDLLPYLPVLAGRIVDSRDVSDRFLADFRKTLGDLAIDHHYRLFRDNAHRHGLEIHPESGGPHASPIDAQRCLGWDDAPMSEFWAWSWRHRIGDENRFFIKQPASAAHTYGHQLVLGEGFTTIGPHWQETIWSNLKPAFDEALCEGLNLLVWHAVVCSPDEMGLPGQQYFAGTHFNPNTTWWPKSGAFLSYINRCQYLLQQGRFTADVCYYYGDHVPNFAQLKHSDPAHVLPGYDYDVITEEVLLERMSVKNGRLVLPDGMGYRMLVLPERTVISLPALRKLKELVAAGATIIGPKPTEAAGLKDFPRSDAEVAKLAAELWGDRSDVAILPPRFRPGAAPIPGRSYGKGRVIWGRTAREVLLADGINSDFAAWDAGALIDSAKAPSNSTGSGIVFGPDETAAGRPATNLDYIHRSVDGTDVYFIANRSNRVARAFCNFRVSGRTAEIWDPVTGSRRLASASPLNADRTSLLLEFNPCGSLFVIFREPLTNDLPMPAGNLTRFGPLGEIPGPWTVRFDPKLGGPESAQFTTLASWTERAEPGVKYYSGAATYINAFDLPQSVARNPSSKIWLDLGEVHELAEVWLNGQSLGVVWSPPFRVDISGAVRPAGNALKIEVVNFWPNRIIGDQLQPPGSRFTKTNIRKLVRDTPLMESGLLGPVRLLEEQ